MQKVTWWPIEQLGPWGDIQVDLSRMKDRTSPLGMFAHHVQQGQVPPGLPPELWITSPRIAEELAMWLDMPGGRPQDEDQWREFLGRVPFGEIMGQSLGYRIVTTGRDRQKTHVRPVFAWLALDAVAAAWVEMLHAARTGATVRECDLCHTPYIKPTQYKGRWCLACRQLTWRQRGRIEGAPPEERARQALKTWKVILQEKETNDETTAGSR
jgi:hypothetical protein